MVNINTLQIDKSILKKKYVIMERKKHYMPDGTFYITHSCNLTCHNCESYNNKKFKGHYTWEKYKSYYQEWGKIINLGGLINIHGGEPLTNPDIMNWADGLMSIWPDAEEYTVSSNGTLLSNKKELVLELANKGWRWDISVHDPVTFDPILRSLLEIFKKLNPHLVDGHEDEKKIINFKTGKTLATILPQYYFLRNSTRYIKKGVIHMWRNDIKTAHRLCQSESRWPGDTEGENPCRFFVAGKLFKCHLTAITEDLIKQFTIEEEAVELLKQYKPADPFEPRESVDNFIENLHKPLDQCTLCPVSRKTFPIYPLSKKKQ